MATLRTRLFIFCLLAHLPLFAQQKATIEGGPVRSFTKAGVLATRVMSHHKYLSEAVYARKGEWILISAQADHYPLSLDVFDRSVRKYVATTEDTERVAQRRREYRSTLFFQADRSDTFDVLIGWRMRDTAGSAPVHYEEGPDIDYTLSVYEPSWQPRDTAWGFVQRLSYLCNNWTAAFDGVPKTFDTTREWKDNIVTEFFPLTPVPVDPRMSQSFMLLGGGSTLACFMYSADAPYREAKALYDELARKLRSATEKSKVSVLGDIRRIKEEATSAYGIRVPDSRVHYTYTSLEEAGKGYSWLPVNLFLLGDKNTARVIVTIGEMDTDVYDIGL